mgnify:CR=1 FL=1
MGGDVYEELMEKNLLSNSDLCNFEFNKDDELPNCEDDNILGDLNFNVTR